MPSNIPVAPKSQYEIERDERIKRNEAFMLSIGIDPHGGGYMKQNKKKAPPKPRLPRKKVPESERRRSSRLQGGTAGPERLTYDEWSDDERPRQRSRGSGGRRARKNRLVELSEEQRAALATFDMDDFEAWMEPDGEHPISDDNRRQVIRQVTKLVSGEGVHYASPAYGWPDDVIFRKDEPVTMQSDAVPNQNSELHAIDATIFTQVGHRPDHRGRARLRGRARPRPRQRLAPEPPPPQAPHLPDPRRPRRGRGLGLGGRAARPSRVGCRKRRACGCGPKGHRGPRSLPRRVVFGNTGVRYCHTV